MNHYGRLYVKKDEQYEELLTLDVMLETENDTAIYVACASCKKIKAYGNAGSLLALDLFSYSIVCYDCEIGSDSCWKCKKYLEIDGDVLKCSCQVYCIKCHNPQKSEHFHPEKSYIDYYYELLNNRIGFFQIPEYFRTHRVLYCALKRDTAVMTYHCGIRPDLYIISNNEPIKIPERNMKYKDYCHWSFEYVKKLGTLNNVDQKRLTDNDFQVLCLHAVTNSAKVLGELTRKPLDIVEVYLKAITKFDFSIDSLSATILNDAEYETILRKLLTTRPNIISNLMNPPFKLCLSAIRINAHNVRHFHNHQFSVDKYFELCHEAAQIDSSCLKYFLLDRKKYFLLCNEIVKKDAMSLQHIQHFLLDKEEYLALCCMAASRDGNVIQHIKIETVTQSNYVQIARIAVVSDAIKNKLENEVCSLSFLDDKKIPSKIYKGIVKFAVQRNGNALKHITDPSNYYDMCLNAIRSTPLALKYVRSNMMSTKNYLNICKSCVKRSKDAIRFVNSAACPSYVMADLMLIHKKHQDKN